MQKIEGTTNKYLKSEEDLRDEILNRWFLGTLSPPIRAIGDEEVKIREVDLQQTKPVFSSFEQGASFWGALFFIGAAAGVPNRGLELIKGKPKHRQC